MRLSTQTRYGVRAIFDIAYNSGGGEIQVKDISRRQGISPRYIEQIFQKLKKAGIIGSKRGPTGGYFLNKRAEEISIGEIIKVTERDINPVNCKNNKGSKKPCEKSGNCVTELVWNEAGKKLSEYFNSITIRDLCEMAREMGIEREIDKNYMYYI